jgi:hypothetical protein
MSRWLVTVSGASEEAIAKALEGSDVEVVSEEEVAGTMGDGEEVVLSVEADDGEDARREAGIALEDVDGASVGSAAQAGPGP